MTPRRTLALAALVASTGLAIAALGAGRPALADDDVGVRATNGFIAVTGQSREDTETLYLIDTEKQILLIYETDRGRGIRLVAVRSFRFDRDLLEYNDLSERGFKASDLKKRLEEKAAPPEDAPRPPKG